MSVNKFMHPRNIYKTPPNFKQLALEFPEFRQFVTQELSGKVTFDFKNHEALRALSWTLLKKDFAVDVEIPLNKLIPTIPLRLNYILWLEDLLSVFNKTNKIKGIDIGTGASCIYPLLAAKKNGWFMLATEVDEESFACAKSNVIKNSLENLIDLIRVDAATILKDAVYDGVYDFCMCNPPFFGSTQELHPSFKARKPDRPKPKNSFCASVQEVVVKGGEVDFISKLIFESKDLGKQVKMYSTMIGHKKNLPILKSLLREVNVISFKETEFCQGNTTRWGLAWTFCEDINLKNCIDPIKQLIKKSKPKEPLIYKVPKKCQDFNTVREDILKLFGILKMTVEDISNIKRKNKYLVRAFSNSWSNQRRRRREVLKIQSESINSTGENDNDSSTSLEEIEMEGSVKSPGKREHEECLDGNIMKKLKISDTELGNNLFTFIISFRLDNSDITMEMNCDADSNRDYLHQIFQYIKNHLIMHQDSSMISLLT